MKLRMIACAAMTAAALGATSASAQIQQQNVTFVGDFVDAWQQRIVNENLRVAEPKTWALRTGPKIAALSAERFALAQRATTIEELEMLLVSAPIANGTTFGALSVGTPGNISLNAMQLRQDAVAKSDPGANPTLYNDLVFTMTDSCRMYDSRVVSGGAGPWMNGVQRLVKVGPYSAAGGGYATGGGAQGGSASGCGLDTFAPVSGNAIRAVMVAVSTVNQSNNGYLTFSSATQADPSLSVVSMWYRSGFIQTSFVVFPTDAIGESWSAGIARQANTEVIIDVVGYFAKPLAAALDCVNTALVTSNINNGPLNGGVYWSSAIPPACAAGYTSVALRCLTNNAMASAHEFDTGTLCGGNAFGNNTYTLSAGRKCCRTAGR